MTVRFWDVGNVRNELIRRETGSGADPGGGGRRRPDPPSNFPKVPFSQEDFFLLGLAKS